MNRVLICAAAAAQLLLSACSLTPFGAQAKAFTNMAIDAAVQDRKDYNDTKAAVLPVLTCDISVGAYGRMPESNVKHGIGCICGLETNCSSGGEVVTALQLFESIRALQEGRPISAPPFGTPPQTLLRIDDMTPAVAPEIQVDPATPPQ